MTFELHSFFCRYIAPLYLPSIETFLTFYDSSKSSLVSMFCTGILMESEKALYTLEIMISLSKQQKSNKLITNNFYVHLI